MAQKQVSNKLLVLGMIASMFLWGLSWPSGKVLTRYCSAINFSVYRYIFVILAMIVLLPLTGTSFRIKKAGIPVFLASGFFLAIYGYFFFLGLKNGAPGAGGILVTILNPLMAYTIGNVISRKLPARNEAVGLGLGLIAGCILLKVWDTSISLMDSGNVYFLLASLSWAVLSKFTSKGGLYGSSLTFSFWQYIVTLLCLLPLADFKEMSAAIHIVDPVFWLNLLFSSIIVTAIATTVYFYSTTRLGAEKASSFLFLVPMAAGVSSWLLLGEQLRVHTIIGGIVGLGAVYMINKRSTT